MSDATLPLPPHSSSAAPVSEGQQRADSSSGEGEFDTSLDQSTESVGREENTDDFGGRADNKQKRKRTRYEEFSYLLARLDSSFGLSNSCIYGQLEVWNAFRGHC
jgi:hypothetical protein